MSHVPNSQRKLFMKWKNTFWEIKIAFVDPGDITVIFVSDAAKAIIDILPSHEPSLAPGGCGCLGSSSSFSSLFWGCVEVSSPGELLLAAEHRSAGRLFLPCARLNLCMDCFSFIRWCILAIPWEYKHPLPALGWWGLEAQNSTVLKCESGIWAIPMLSRVLPFNQV